MTITDKLRERDLLTVAQDIARELHVTVEDMFSRSRERPHPEGRGRFYAYLFALGWSYPAIGRLVSRDHTSIISSLATYGVQRRAA